MISLLQKQNPDHIGVNTGVTYSTIIATPDTGNCFRLGT